MSQAKSVLFDYKYIHITLKFFALFFIFYFSYLFTKVEIFLINFWMSEWYSTVEQHNNVIAVGHFNDVNIKCSITIGLIQK